jgi:hypothetical protein
MTYKGTLVMDLQSIVEACFERNRNRSCTERKQPEERAIRRSLNDEPMEHFADPE